MNNKPLDPGLASILDSIRASIGGEGADTAETSTPAPSSSTSAMAKETTPAAAPTTPVRSVEDFLADLARPHVKAWVEENLPEIVQKLAAEEVRRLTGG